MGGFFILAGGNRRRHYRTEQALPPWPVQRPARRRRAIGRESSTPEQSPHAGADERQPHARPPGTQDDALPRGRPRHAQQAHRAKQQTAHELGSPGKRRVGRHWAAPLQAGRRMGPADPAARSVPCVESIARKPPRPAARHRGRMRLAIARERRTRLVQAPASRARSFEWGKVTWKRIGIAPCTLERFAPSQRLDG